MADSFGLCWVGLEEGKHLLGSGETNDGSQLDSIASRRWTGGERWIFLLSNPPLPSLFLLRKAIFPPGCQIKRPIKEIYFFNPRVLVRYKLAMLTGDGSSVA
jgi:hypothetical protein